MSDMNSAVLDPTGPRSSSDQSQCVSNYGGYTNLSLVVSNEELLDEGVDAEPRSNPPWRLGGNGAPSTSLTNYNEPTPTLERSVSRWTLSTRSKQKPATVDRKVRALLNKLVMERFGPISDQIIACADTIDSERDGHTLRDVVRVIYESATFDPERSELYARLCRKTMDTINPDVQDGGCRNYEGKVITGGLLFRKYVLDHCQEGFERGWTQRESTFGTGVFNTTGDQAINDATGDKKESRVRVIRSEEYYAAEKAKWRYLGLIKFIGELFKYQLLTGRIMHVCIKRLLSNVDSPEGEGIEALCILLTTVGQSLDTSKARGHMDVYFSRMEKLTKSSKSSRIRFLLKNVIELRERKWSARRAVATPTPSAISRDRRQGDHHG